MSDEPGEIRMPTEAERTNALDCLRCGSVVRAEGPVDLRTGGHSGGWSVLFGGWADVDEQLMKLLVFSCPKCGHIEFRVPIA
jgi:predicted nucleic-acid-binding Zn-ribbon protein